MKILVAGNGKVGETLVKQLSEEGYDLTLIDSDPQVLESGMERYDVMTVQGNCASMETLRRAGVERADLLIATTGMDELNLLCCMTAHGLNPGLHTIARIRTPEYAEQAYIMRDTFGLSLSFNPEKQAADEIDKVLKYPGFLKRDTFAKGQVEIVELKIDRGSKLADIQLSTMYNIVKCKVLVCSVLRNGTAITPDGNFILREGDRIFVTAPSNNLSVLLKNLGIVTKKVRKAVLVGGGNVSYYLAQKLLAAHMEVDIIEKDKERCVRLAALLPRASVIHGDASEQDVIERTLGDCDAIVTLTGLDELNIIVSLYANSCNIPKVITKLSRGDDSNVINSLPIGSIISPRRLCCNTIVRYVRALKNQSGAAVTIHSIADGNAEALEFLADKTTLNCGKPLKTVKLKKNILIVCITKEGKIEIPNGDSFFNEGDSIVVVSSQGTVISQLNDIFE